MLIRKIKPVALLFSLAVFLVSCTGVEISPDITNPIKTVAVLPLYNATYDIDAPVLLRDSVSSRLRKYRYTLLSQDEVDDGISGLPPEALTDISQARALGERLGVDGLLYGYILNYDVVMEDSYKVRRVRVGFILVDVKLGRPIWSGGEGVKSEYEGKFAGIPQANYVQNPEGIAQFENVPAIGDIEGIRKWKSLTGNRAQLFSGTIPTTGDSGVAASSWGFELASETVALLNDVFKDLPMGPGN